MPAGRVLLIEPCGFRPNLETAETNAFQAGASLSDDVIEREAVAEHRGLADALREAGVEVVMFENVFGSSAPDALFPNNWLVSMPDKRLVICPLLTPNRQLEVREDIVKALGGSDIVDLRPFAGEGVAMEGTGSLVIDHQAKVAYMARSPRSSVGLADRFCQIFGYELYSFDATGPGGLPIYHTNVLMAMGQSWVVVCLDALTSGASALADKLAASGKQVVDISREQMASFAGNILELMGSKGPVVVMSQTALASFTRDQLAVLESEARIIAVPLSTIEKVGGGGVRCCLAELF